MVSNCWHAVATPPSPPPCTEATLRHGRPPSGGSRPLVLGEGGGGGLIDCYLASPGYRWRRPAAQRARGKSMSGSPSRQQCSLLSRVRPCLKGAAPARPTRTPQDRPGHGQTEEEEKWRIQVSSQRGWAADIGDVARVVSGGRAHQLFCRFLPCWALAL